MTKATTYDLVEIGRRMNAARGALNLTQASFCEKYGHKLRTYQKNEAGSNEAGIELVESFARAGVNTNWLLTGEGDMFLTAASHQLQERQPAPYLGKDGVGYVAVPLYNNVQASAGAGALVGEEVADGFMRFSEEWLRVELGVRLRDLYMIRASGDSMEPTFRSGDALLIDRRATIPDSEGIYIMRSGASLLVKRLQLLPGRRVRVSSDNPLYQPYELLVSDLNDDDVAVIGRVVWSGRRL